MSAPLVAGPLGEEKKKEKLDPSSETQGRRASENGDNSSQEQRGAVAHIKDWDDLLHEQISQQSQSSSAADDNEASEYENFGKTEETSEESRGKILEKLAQAAQQAYARGDEHHSDWDQVAKLIEDLRPENGEEHAKRRLSVGDTADEAQEAEAEELQLHFFCATLPAIKKTSVVAALRGLNNFKTAAIIGKANEEHSAWEAAKASFEVVCRDRILHATDNSRIHTVTSQEDDTDFYLPGPFDAYLRKLNYKIDRSKIENQLDALHHEIIQGIINANVTTEDFEKRAFDATGITERYQPLLEQIAAAKEKADLEVQDKWEQFHQEAAARYLEDLSQVAKIKLWQNRNEVASMNKTAERAHERAERAATATGAATWQRALEEGEAAKDAWIERNNQLAAARRNIEVHKSTLALKISTAIEKEIEGAISEAEQAIAYWGARSAQVPLRIIEASINHTQSLYQIALGQHEVETQLKNGGNPALARYNKEKYLGLASEQYGKTMQLVQEVKADASRVLDVAWNDQIEQFKKEFQDKHLFLLMAPFVKSEEQVKQWEEATTNLRAAQQQEEVHEVNGNTKPSEGVKAFFEAIKDYRASKHALNTTSQIPPADDSALR